MKQATRSFAIGAISKKKAADRSLRHAPEPQPKRDDLIIFYIEEGIIASPFQHLVDVPRCFGDDAAQDFAESGVMSIVMSDLPANRDKKRGGPQLCDSPLDFW